MIVEHVTIEKFRKFENLDFDLGNQVTAIVGQNGTQKTTLLGLISQPFSLRDQKNPLYTARTIDGLKFESKLLDKFKFSPTFDLPGQHRWTLTVNPEVYPEGSFTVKSISRTQNKTTKSIRFWNAAGREQGDGYIQCPVIFLSLKRVSPVGEETAIKLDTNSLTSAEKKLFNDYHNKILCLSEQFSEVSYMSSGNKRTLGPQTSTYDALTISSGQDNIGKILLSLFSFKRLYENYPHDYKGGILLIDELDATLFPAAQEQLVHVLFHFAAKYKIQIIFTTHSYNIIEVMKEPRYSYASRLIYLMNVGDHVEINNNASLEAIDADLKIRVLSSQKNTAKINIYTEDAEAMLFVKRLLDRRISKKHLRFMDGVSLGCKNYKDLMRRHVPEFIENLVILDGDERTTSLDNVVILPKDGKSPEQLFYDYLMSLEPEHPFWDNSVGGYKKQVCFRDYPNLPRNREEYKKWFNSQLPYWGLGGKKLFNMWKKDNSEAVDTFLNDFIQKYNRLAKQKGLNKLQ